MRKLALAVGCAVVLAAPAAADAKTWRGKTKQGRAVTVRTGADESRQPGARELARAVQEGAST